MLLGRTAELARIEDLLGAARDGTSGTLLLRGEAGIGKTALLDAAATMADGMTALRATGVETESALSYSGLSELLGPVLERIEEIPAPQGAALSGALAIGPPFAADRLAVCAGTLSLIAAAAEDQPVLVLIDDVQWIDASSAEALLFTARRIHAEGIALLFAERSEDPSIFTAPNFEELRLQGLDEESSRALLTRSGRRNVSEETSRRVHEVSQGNPLAVLEIGGLLTDDQLASSAFPHEPLPVGERIGQAFLRRTERLSVKAQVALAVLAANDGGDVQEVTTALRHLDVGSHELTAIESVGFIEIERDHIEWRHPLYKAAAYHNAEADLRRRAHLAIAESIADEAAHARRAWHRAAGVVGPDEDVAADLERAANDARQRLGHAEAARAVERAARLTADPESRARRLLAAGRDLLLMGELDRAVEVLDEATMCTSDPSLRAEIQHQRGSLEMWVIGPAAARSYLVAEAEKIEAIDPARAAMMLAEASVTHTMDGDIAGSLRLAERAEKVAVSAPEPVQIAASSLVGGALVLMGEAHKGGPLVLRTREVFEAIDPLEATPLVHSLAHVSLWLEEYDTTRRVLEKVIGAARPVGAIGLLAYPLACLSELEFRQGRWTVAYAAAYESVEFAQRRGMENQLAFSLSCLAMIEAGTGREDDCRAHVETALDIAAKFGTESILSYCHSALGLLELGLSRPQEAITQLEIVSSLVAKHGVKEPSVVEWTADLIAAYARVGETERAAELLARFETLAEHTGRVSALAAVARCRGLLDDFPAAERHFETALRLHEKVPRPFERARTELQLGRKLRRARRPVDAREPLRNALGTFESLGARAWADQTRSELIAAGGERRSSQRGSPVEALGPQEVQVALMVADGLTNREIAAALFLSPKTIEFHLGKIYRKLSIRSRSELVRLITRQEEGRTI